MKRLIEQLNEYGKGQKRLADDLARPSGFCEKLARDFLKYVVEAEENAGIESTIDLRVESKHLFGHDVHRHLDKYTREFIQELLFPKLQDIGEQKKCPKNDSNLELSGEQKALLDWYYGHSLRAVNDRPTRKLRECAWNRKRTDLKPGDVIFARAQLPASHYLIGLGQIRKYSGIQDNRFRFWTHPAMVVWMCNDKYLDQEHGQTEAHDFMVVQSVQKGVGLISLADFLSSYEYRCWAFESHLINGGDIPQIQQAVTGYTHHQPLTKFIHGKVVKIWRGLEYGMLTNISIAFGILFGHMRLRFSLAEQLNCSGLVANLLERGSYRFTEGSAHAFPADVARQVVAPKLFNPVSEIQPGILKHLCLKKKYWYTDWLAYKKGIVLLLQQFPGKLWELFGQVLLILVISVICFTIVAGAGWVLASEVSAHLANAKRHGGWELSAIICGGLIASALSIRVFPRYSTVVIPLGLAFDLWLARPERADGNQIPPIPFVFSLFDTIALAVGTATILFSAWAILTLLKNAFWPFLINLVWRPKKI